MGYAAREIYRLARGAGFAPSQAVTMTAIALAESNGDPNAHNPNGENSQGLWQINAKAHKWAKNLYDPATNAEAAFRVSQGGKDISPWTVTHGGSSARYLRYQEKAQAAAMAEGDGSGLGNWSGVSGYGDTTPADGGGATGGGDSQRLQAFLQAALAQKGDTYDFGAEVKLSDSDPDTFDCSELTQWAAHQAGVKLVDGASAQYLQLKDAGTDMSVEQALKTPGALLFSFSEEPTPGGGRPAQAHVAISLGDGRTIEARNSQDDVGTFEASTGRFNYAGVVPGLGTGSNTSLRVASAALMTEKAVDSDGDGISDELETSKGLDKNDVDTDDDNLSDFYELAESKTNPLVADTDGDKIVDSVELGLGLNPLSPDSNRDGHLDALPGAPLNFVDTDSDSLDDDLEKILRTNATSADTDRDGFLDGAEYLGGFDPNDELNNPISSSATTAPNGSPTTPAPNDAADATDTLAS